MFKTTQTKPVKHSKLACGENISLNQPRAKPRRPAPSAKSHPAHGVSGVLSPGARGELLLVDISNTFVKLAIAKNGRIGRVHRLPTKSLRADQILAITDGHRLKGTVAASVVPEKCRAVNAACGPGVCWVGPDIALGVGIDYPSPRGIGPDRLANAAGCRAHYGVPAIVVDFGTAVTFDVLSAGGDYIGGVIAPGLNAMTEYLHDRTALLPFIKLSEPVSAVGRSTRDAMISGAVYGYRGLVSEIIHRVKCEAFPRRRPKVIATGGDASLIASGSSLFDAVDPLLTLRGLLVVAKLNL